MRATRVQHVSGAMHVACVLHAWCVCVHVQDQVQGREGRACARRVRRRQDRSLQGREGRRAAPARLQRQGHMGGVGMRRMEAEAKAREQQRKRPPTEDGLQQLLRERTERKARDEATRLSVHAELKTRMDTGVRFNPLLARAAPVAGFHDDFMVCDSMQPSSH